MRRFLTISTVMLATTGAAAADPPPELAAMGVAMTGTWKCKGQGLGSDHGKLVDMTATTTWTVEMGGWWLHEAFTGTMSDGVTHRFDGYVTYDPRTKKWKRVIITGGGGWNDGEASASCSTNPFGCKLDWQMTNHTMMGDFAFKDHVDATDLKTAYKGWGELSPDHGKTWMKAYQLTCTGK